MNFTRVFIVCAFLASTPSQAQLFKSKKKSKSAVNAPAKKNSAPPSIAEKTKGMSLQKGLFDLYRDTQSGELYMQISTEQFNKEYIHFTYTENGVIEVGHHRGSYRGSRILSFKRRYNQIDVVQHNTNYYFDPKNEVSKAANANISASILASEKIVALDTSGAILVSADALFLTDKLHEINAGSRGPKKGFKLGRISKDKTHYEQVKNYPENTDFIVNYAFDNPSPEGGSESVADNRYVNILLQHSLIEVPKNNFKPRRDDYRIGYFTEKINDMTATAYTNYPDVIHR